MSRSLVGDTTEGIEETNAFLTLINILKRFARFANIFAKISGYVCAVKCTRSLLTLHDIEREALQMLKSFGIPTLTSLTSNLSVVDENEIDIDDDGKSDDNRDPKDFLDFGVGPLSLHVDVRAFFPLPIVRKLSSEDVLNSLLEYKYHLNERSDESAIHIPDFILYICEIYNVNSLCQLGVIISGDLRAELLLVGHANSYHRDNLISLKRQLMTGRKVDSACVSCGQNGNSKCSESSISYRTESSLENCAGTSNQTETITKITFKDPVDVNLKEFLAAISRELDSPYSPSQAKLRSAIIKLQQNGDVPVSAKKDMGTGKRRKINDSEKLPTRTGSFTDWLLAAATEYECSVISFSPFASFFHYFAVPPPPPLAPLAQGPDNKELSVLIYY